MKKTTLSIFTTTLLLTATLSARPINYFAEGSREVKDKDYKAAFKTFMEGVNAGDPRSMDYMGWLYLEGKGVRAGNMAKGRR